MNRIVYWSRLFIRQAHQTLPRPNPMRSTSMPSLTPRRSDRWCLTSLRLTRWITGTIMDCWQTALEDVGPAG